MVAIREINNRVILLEASVKATPLLDDERPTYRAIKPVFERYEPTIRRDIEQGTPGVYQGLAQDLQTAMLPPLMDVYRNRIREYEAETGYNTDLELEIPTDWIRSYAIKGWLSDAIQGVAGTIQDLVAKAAQAYVRAAPGTERRRMLDEFLTRILGRNRMEMIATTETTRARSQATADYVQRLRRDGATVRQIWREDRASNTCPLCLANVGRDIEDIGQAPPLHPRCRCDIEIVIVEVLP